MVLTIERIGGLGGFGLPGSRIRSRGTISLDALSAEDRDHVMALFASHAASTPAGHPDGFIYRLTRRTAAGDETVEVPESAVPQALIAGIRDEID